jgi:ketosteroid isomerase-like protein
MHRLKLRTCKEMTVHESARYPSDLVRFLVSRINAGDLDGLVALYEPDAILVADDGNFLVGQDAIRAFYRTLLSANPQFAQGREAAPVINSGIALTSSTLADGTTTAEIARLQADGSWLWIIDQPAIVRLQSRSAA